MSVKIGVTAPGAIAGFTVTIDSPALTAEMLATVGLATELNLVNPGSMAEALGALDLAAMAELNARQGRCLEDADA